jgi:hypothetical protein
VIEPLSFDPDCCQLRLNVPSNPPLYLPDQVPDSELASGALVAELAAAAELVVGDDDAGTCGGADWLGLPPPLELHAATPSTSPIANGTTAPARRDSHICGLRSHVPVDWSQPAEK